MGGFCQLNFQSNVFVPSWVEYKTHLSVLMFKEKKILKTVASIRKSKSNAQYHFGKIARIFLGVLVLCYIFSLDKVASGLMLQNRFISKTDFFFHVL